MATLDMIAVAAADAGFRSKVQAAVITACRLIRQAAQNPSDKRRELALKVLLAPSSLTDTAAWTLASAGLSTGSQDAAIQAGVDQLLTNITSG